jgi:UDP-glucose 4-epimerase
MNLIGGSRILVTGGAGFIGSAIVDQMVAAGAAEVRVLDNFVRGTRSNLAAALASGRVTVIQGDIRDAQLVDRLTEDSHYVFHQAALRITRCADAPSEALEVMINGTQNVLNAAVKHKVRKVVAASSASVYGEPDYLPMNEVHPFNNRTLYGAAKIANEQMLRAYHEMFGLRYVALRYFNVFGPRMDVEGVYTEVMIRWLDAIDAGTAPAIFGDGAQSMDFIYVRDVARANRFALQSEIADEVFNVGTGVQTSLNQLCQILLLLTGSPLQPDYRAPRNVANISARQAAILKAEKLLGFRAMVDLEQGLRGLIGWRESLKTAAVRSAA